MVSRLGAENRSKSQLAKKYAKCSYLYSDAEAGLRKALAIYERMSDLAAKSIDPLISDSDRADFSSEFDSLRRNPRVGMYDTFSGKFLYDDMAATVKKTSHIQ